MKSGSKENLDAKCNKIDGPFFSIIITCYNYEKYIKACIESALIQDYEKYEIIVVDDGSTDDSLDIISEYNLQVRVISTPNQGFIKACLLGLSNSRGTHVMFLDADDIIHPNFLSKAAEHLNNPRVSKVQVMMQPIDGDGKSVRSPFPNLSRHTNQTYWHNCIIKSGCYPTPPTSGNVYRRDVYDNIGDISYDYGIDGVAYLFAVFCGEVVHIQEVLADYRIHGNNLSSQGGLSAIGFRRNADTFIRRLHHLKQLISSYSAVGTQFEVGRNYQYVVEASVYADIMSDKNIGLDRAMSFFNGRVDRIPSKRDLSMTILMVLLSILPRSKAKELISMRYRKSRSVGS